MAQFGLYGLRTSPSPGPAGAGGDPNDVALRMAQVFQDALRELLAGEEQRAEKARQQRKEDEAEARERARGGQFEGFTDVQREHALRSVYPTQTLGGMARLNRVRALRAIPGIQDPEARYFRERYEGETGAEYAQAMLALQKQEQARKVEIARKNRAATAAEKARRAVSGKRWTGYSVTEQPEERGRAERTRLAGEYARGERIPTAAGPEGEREMAEAAYAIEHPGRPVPRRPSTYTTRTMVEGAAPTVLAGIQDVEAARKLGQAGTADTAEILGRLPAAERIAKLISALRDLAR